jgi:hypothetical protein
VYLKTYPGCPHQLQVQLKSNWKTNQFSSGLSSRPFSPFQLSKLRKYDGEQCIAHRNFLYMNAWIMDRKMRNV